MSIITLTKFSNLRFNKRIDSEFYNPHLLHSYSKLENSKLYLHNLNSLCIIKSGTTPKDRDDNLMNGPILLKTTDIRNSVLNPFSKYYHISEEIFSRMSSTILNENDVLLNIVGATLEVIGRASFVPNDFGKANITQAMVFLRVKSDILPGYLFAYLASYFAQDQVKRFARPTGQYNLNLNEVGKITIPIVDNNSQSIIHSAIIKSGELLSNSSFLYSQATQLLEQELGLDKLQFKSQKTYTAIYSEVVNNNRADAEYYDVKFAPILEKISTYSHGSLPLISLIDTYKPNFNVSTYHNTDFNYIEIGDINVYDGSFELKIY